MNKRRNRVFLSCGITGGVCLLVLIFCLSFLAVRAGGTQASAEAAESTEASGSLFSRLFPTYGMKNAEPPESVVVSYMQGIDVDETGQKCLITADGGSLYIDRPPAGDEAKLLCSLLQGSWSWQMDPAAIEGTEAAVNVYITCPSLSAMAPLVQSRMQELLEERVEAASAGSDVYNEDESVRQDVLDDLFWAALGEASAQAKEQSSVTVQAQLRLSYFDRAWHVTNPAGLQQSLDVRVAQMKETAAAALTYIPKIQPIDETATAGPEPLQSSFGSTGDPAAVSALLTDRRAQRLIGDETPVFSEEIDFIPGTLIRYYLDESLLMIQWQEEEAGMVGTFAEIFTADGSQIRRKIAGDSYGDMNFCTASEFAAQTNAVLAVGGDFYNHARNCGIVVYQRQIWRFDPSTCDTCYVTASGDLLFSYRNQFSSQEEAQRFVDENDILFSLCFGPVLIDEGQDVTPDDYLWGEIRDTYARAALGMFGERHYLTMNLNCGTGEYYHYATLRQAADAMLAKGCRKAYTLDGGQTCTTVVNGELVSPVQFGWEKAVSDILYFCTAVPGGGE